MNEVLTLDVERLIDRYLDGKFLDRYFELLMEQNRAVNLVSRETSRRDFDRLVAESLLPLEHLSLPVANYLDIGAGGGIPGIPILIAGAVSGKSFLVERTTKKARALSKIVEQLEVPAEVIPGNFEEIRELPRLELVTMRYVKLVPQLLKNVMKTLASGGVFVYYSAFEFEARGVKSITRQFGCPQSSALKSFTIFQK